MPSLSEQRVPTKRRALLSWLPISIVALMCVAVVVAVIALQNSWWNDADARPSEDQQAVDGMSLFSPAGMDYLTRDGVMRVKVRADSLSATDLGLEPDASQVFEPISPSKAVVLGADGAFTLDLVKSFTITTVDDRVESVSLVQDGPGTWLEIYPQLEKIAAAWGWSDEQLDQLQTDLTTASRTANGATYSAALPEVQHKGALSSAEVTIDQDHGTVGLTFILRTLP